MLLMREGGGLAGGADGHDPFQVGLHLRLDEPFEAIVIDFAVGNRSGQRCVGSV